MGKSFDPIGLVEEMRDAKRCSSTPRPIVSMSFQLAIPWRVALPQSSPPLHQPGASMNERAAASQQKPANGQLCLNYLSHPRGQVQLGPGNSYVLAIRADRRPLGGVTEGPAWDGTGLLFTHIPASRIMRWDPATRLSSVYRESTNCANGLMFDPQGVLYACEGDARGVVRYDSVEKVTIWLSTLL